MPQSLFPTEIPFMFMCLVPAFSKAIWALCFEVLFHEFTEYGGFCCYKKNECKPDILELKVITNTSTRVNKFKSHKFKKKKKKNSCSYWSKDKKFYKIDTFGRW